MERRESGRERLVVPTDFTSPTGSSGVQEDLVPPSHFASSAQCTAAHRGVQSTQTALPWANPGPTSVPPGDPGPASPWLAITRAQQEILELRKENQRIMMLQETSIRGRVPVDRLSNLKARPADPSGQWSSWESELLLEAEKHKAEAERFRVQVKALKESVGRHREEVRDRDGTLSRQSSELEAMREELCKAKTELIQIKEELVRSNAQKEKISSQLEILKTESGEETKKLRRDVERRVEEAQELALKAEMDRLQAEEEAKQQSLRLSEHLEEMQRKREVELQQLNASHSAELAATRKTNSELQDRLQSMTSEVLQLKSTLIEVSTERDGLKEHLSKMGQAFETQSATLHSLRNYIGQLAPEKREKEQLNEAVERLNKEKAALQMTTELLTVRLNSANEILSLQEEKMVKKQTSGDPLVKNGPAVLQVIQLWREKVFKLCVQLRSKDIELRGEQEKLLSKLRSTEQQVQQEQYRANILQHSLDDRIAELDLERVEKETLKQELAHARKDNFQLKLQSQKSEAEIKILTKAVSRFSDAFKSKAAEMDTAQTRLVTFTQRLIFAQRRVETIQGLIMRRVALHKVQQAGKWAEEPCHSITNLQTELSLVCEERDRLTQELKRTPELIEKALADLKEHYESKQRQQQQELEESWVEVRQAVAGREKAEQSLKQIQAQLEETKVNLEKLCSELLSQQEHSERALQERVSEIEDCCAEKLRAMEVQVSMARREHTKAVMTLRQFEREAARKQEMRESQYLRAAHAKQLENEQQKETEKDTSLLLATVAERRLMSEYPRVHTTAPQSSAAPREQRQKPSDRSGSAGTKVQVRADERLLSVLEELHTLSTAVVNSSEDSAEEEGQSNSVGPSTGSLHS